MAAVKRREAVAVKADRLARQSVSRRRGQWLRAGRAAVEAGYPLTVAITITWSACLASELRCGHWLGKSEEERVKDLWDRLRRLANDHGVDRFLAARAPEYDHTKGLHLHMMLHMPETALRPLVQLIERVTGAPAAKIDIENGFTVKSCGRPPRLGCIALGDHKAWLVQRNLRPEGNGTEGFLGYISKAPPSGKTRTQYRLSKDLLALGRGSAR